MNYFLIFHPKAEDEYKKAFQKYEQDQTGLGERFETMVEKRLEQIAEHPEFYHIGKAPFREVAVEFFPYCIVYKFNKRKKQINISSIYHTKRHPRHKYRK